MKKCFPLPNGNLVTLHQENCLKGLQEIEMSRVGVIITSPPYNIGTQYGTYNDKVDEFVYLLWLDDVCYELARVLADEGSFFLNLGYRPSDPGFPFRVAERVQKHFHLQNVIHWIKSISIDEREAWVDSDGEEVFALQNVQSYGHYKPINSQLYLNGCHEYLFHFTHEGNVKLDRLAVGVPYVDKTNLQRGTRGKNGDVRCRGNTWFIPYETIQCRELDRPHPAPFPSQLPEMCLKLHGLDRCGLVVDPFLGLGNTALAAVRHGLAFAGFEIDSDYFAVATRWVEEAVSCNEE